MSPRLPVPERENQVLGDDLRSSSAEAGRSRCKCGHTKNLHTFGGGCLASLPIDNGAIHCGCNGFTSATRGSASLQDSASPGLPVPEERPGESEETLFVHTATARVIETIARKLDSNIPAALDLIIEEFSEHYPLDLGAARGVSVEADELERQLRVAVAAALASLEQERDAATDTANVRAGQIEYLRARSALLTEALRRGDWYEKSFATAHAKMTAAEQELEEARRLIAVERENVWNARDERNRVLRTYGWHKNGCGFQGSGYPETCDCGWLAALASTTGQPAEPDTGVAQSAPSGGEL
jgi:hypothetical protein